MAAENQDADAAIKQVGGHGRRTAFRFLLSRLAGHLASEGQLESAAGTQAARQAARETSEGGPKGARSWERPDSIYRSEAE